MRIQSDNVRGLAHGLPADAGMGEPLRLDKHGWEEAQVQHAATTLAGLIAPRHPASDGESPAGHPVNKDSLKDYVWASLGMAHDETRIDPELAPYLDELSPQLYRGKHDAAMPRRASGRAGEHHVGLSSCRWPA